MLLAANSRLAYSELAEKLNLSVNAVHKRIQALIEQGIIAKFTAKVSLLGAQAIVVFVSGTSQLSSFQTLPEKIHSNNCIYWLTLGSGKYVHIGAYLKNVYELEQLVNFVKKEADLPDPVVGIMAVAPYPVPLKISHADLVLCSLDYKIIYALKDNSRRDLSEVASEVDVSTKTVRRRLNRMIENSLIELSVEWYPDKSNDTITLLNVQFKPETDPKLLLGSKRPFSPIRCFFGCMPICLTSQRMWLGLTA
jgi:DNA-binding Lrp family transcriptional regulator